MHLGSTYRGMVIRSRLLIKGRPHNLIGTFLPLKGSSRPSIYLVSKRSTIVIQIDRYNLIPDMDKKFRDHLSETVRRSVMEAVILQKQHSHKTRIQKISKETMFYFKYRRLNIRDQRNSKISGFHQQKINIGNSITHQ